MADPAPQMNAFAFAVGMAQALAWPTCIIVVVFTLKKQISSVIGRVKSLKYGDAELNFAEELRRAQDVAAKEGVTLRRPVGRFISASNGDAYSSPVAAILEGWIEIERPLRTLSDQHGYNWRSSAQAIRNLVENGILTPGHANILQQLAELRNRVVHSTGDLSEGEALEFLMLAKSMAERLQQKVQSPP
jgi:hypothetical protein